jgi:hypothetical protein
MPSAAAHAVLHEGATTSLDTRLGRADWGMVIIPGHFRIRGRPRLAAELEPLVLRMATE